jgi:hypothetical protein
MGHSRLIRVNDRFYMAHPSGNGWTAEEVERHRPARIDGYNAGYRPVPRGRVPAGTFRTMAECHEAIEQYVAAHTAK